MRGLISNFWSNFYTAAIFLLTLGGFALRLRYLTTSHPFFDEYTTVLAARRILEHGRPILPSGLFYEHGLLATYLIAPFTALFINTPLSNWQAAHWGLMLSRWPSLLIGTVTIPLIYIMGRRCFAPPGARVSQKSGRRSQVRLSDDRLSLSLLAAGLFAFSPEGMVWGGRARMYALATLLVLLTVYWAYLGVLYPAPARYRWAALLTLLAALLTQFGVMLLILPLIAAMIVVGWLSWRQWKGSVGSGRPAESRSLPRPWFFRSSIFLEGLALAAVLGLAIFVKRLGRPLGVAPLGETIPEGGLLVELFKTTIAYQTTFHFTWADALTFLSRQFGVPHHFWLTVVTLIGVIVSATVYLTQKQILKPPTSQNIDRGPETADRRPAEAKGASILLPPQSRNYQLPITNYLSPNLPISQSPNLLSLFFLFLGLIFSLLILQIVTLLEPFRRNPRYIVIYLPLFYLIAAGAIFNLWLIGQRFTVYILRTPVLTTRPVQIAVAVVALTLFTAVGYKDLQTALVTPEPAYEKAFAEIYADRRPGDVVVTMNTPAAALYLGEAGGFTVQGAEAAAEFLLQGENGPVDRWLGAPWVGSTAAFNEMLNDNERVWFVIDAIRLGSQQPIYFQGDWVAVLNSQMEQVWAADNALIYRTRPDRTPLPTHPDTLVEATLGDSIQLIGYTLQRSPSLSGQSMTPPENDVSAVSEISMLPHPPLIGGGFLQDRCWRRRPSLLARGVGPPNPPVGGTFLHRRLKSLPWPRLPPMGGWGGLTPVACEPIFLANIHVSKWFTKNLPLSAYPPEETGSLISTAPQSTPRLRPAPRSGQAEPATTLHLTLFWKALAPLPTDYTMFLHLRDSRGATVAQRDGLPLEGVYPTSRWQPGETIIDPIAWPLPETLPSGSYQLVTGLYRLDTLERLPVTGDTSGEHAISLGKVVLP